MPLWHTCIVAISFLKRFLTSLSSKPCVHAINTSLLPHMSPPSVLNSVRDPVNQKRLLGLSRNKKDFFYDLHLAWVDGYNNYETNVLTVTVGSFLNVVALVAPSRRQIYHMPFRQLHWGPLLPKEESPTPPPPPSPLPQSQNITAQLRSSCHHRNSAEHATTTSYIVLQTRPMVLPVATVLMPPFWLPKWSHWWLWASKNGSKRAASMLLLAFLS